MGGGQLAVRQRESWDHHGHEVKAAIRGVQSPLVIASCRQSQGMSHTSRPSTAATSCTARPPQTHGNRDTSRNIRDSRSARPTHRQLGAHSPGLPQLTIRQLVQHLVDLLVCLLLELLVVVDGIERLFHHFFHDPGLDAASAASGGVAMGISDWARLKRNGRGRGRGMLERRGEGAGMGGRGSAPRRW
jgi:hypothetical protein